MTTMDAFVAGLPKVEPHLHIEGNLRRNDLPAPFASVEDGRAAYAFSDLRSLLDLCYRGMHVLRIGEDFSDSRWPI